MRADWRQTWRQQRDQQGNTVPVEAIA